MPPRVTYWTGIWDPAREALSKQVDALRRRHTFTPVVSFSSGQRSALLPRERVVRLGADRWIMLRAVATLLEHRGDVTHVFGGLDDWHLLRALGRRPLLFTVAIAGMRPALALWHKVTTFVAETEDMAEALITAGADPSRVTVVRPGIDLMMFRPGPTPQTSKFRLLFASSPATADEFDARGIPLLIDLARQCDDVEIVLLWRGWGDQTEARRALAALDPPSNVIIESREGRSMTDVYHAAHASVCCYAAGFGKSAPNSIIESLACGRPALVADNCGLADLIVSGRAGCAARRDVTALHAAVDELRRNYQTFASNARMLAERCFDLAACLAAYDELYARVQHNSLRSPRAAAALGSPTP